jgi:hypothetical protein
MAGVGETAEMVDQGLFLGSPRRAGEASPALGASGHEINRIRSETSRPYLRRRSCGV